jgi:hypothetical protein
MDGFTSTMESEKNEKGFLFMDYSLKSSTNVDVTRSRENLCLKEHPRLVTLISYLTCSRYLGLLWVSLFSAEYKRREPRDGDVTLKLSSEYDKPMFYVSQTLEKPGKLKNESTIRQRVEGLELGKR